MSRSNPGYGMITRAESRHVLPASFVAKTIILGNQIGLVLLALLFTAFSYFYLDADLALVVQRLLHNSAMLEQAVSDIPDLLLHAVLVITALCWTGYFFLKRRNSHGRDMRFLRACGTAVPLAFVAKAVLQYVFGRPDPHVWVLYHLPPVFYWFRADQGYGCFPSGHMTVFTALTSTLMHYYPRYRRVMTVLLVLLALALIATNYHFLSDVVAGAVLGAGVAFVANDERLFRKRRG